MHRPRAAEGEQRELARVERRARPSPRGSRAPCWRWPPRARRAPPPRRRARAARRASRSIAAPRRRDVERERAAGEARRQEAERRRWRRSRSARSPPSPVADRARDRRRPTAGRRVSSPPASIAGDRARAAADLGHVHRRHAHHVAAGLDEAARAPRCRRGTRIRGCGQLAAMDQRGRGGGAAHVEGDEVRPRRWPRPAARRPTAPEARPGGDEEDRLRPRHRRASTARRWSSR